MCYIVRARALVCGQIINPECAQRKRTRMRAARWFHCVVELPCVCVFCNQRREHWQLFTHSVRAECGANGARQLHNISSALQATAALVLLHVYKVDLNMNKRRAAASGKIIHDVLSFPLRFQRFHETQNDWRCALLRCMRDAIIHIMCVFAGVMWRHICCIWCIFCIASKYNMNNLRMFYLIFA